ncbi:hypothetical protein HPB50_015995 [Hyalomma asiaticum]|uniref:Uncharacterized protein n=1 Tax=Hyalomma asiaticum TaxID=266040 RepID=A0ACB7TA04_HYAAI|nr:hypothetical protein HPB50_015995 [Hyalomma asiaticum]
MKPLKSYGQGQAEQFTLDDRGQSGASGGSSGVYYARALLLKRWFWRCGCAGSCCIVVPLLVGLVAYYVAGGGRPAAPFFKGGRLSGSVLVDVSQQPILLASLNRSVEPCHNFYRFVCDGWLAREGERLSLLEELALTAQRNAATLLRHVQVPAVGEISAVHKAALLMEKCLHLSRWPPTPDILLEFMNHIGLTWPQPTTMNTSRLISLMVHMSLSWDLNAVFELERSPPPKLLVEDPAGFCRQYTAQFLASGAEASRPRVLDPIRQYVEGFSNARKTTLRDTSTADRVINLSRHCSWDLNAVFELELLPTPKVAGGRPRWVLSPSTQLSSWRRERRHLGPEYLTRIRQYVEGFSNARVTRSLVDSIFEADDEVLRVTNVYRGGGESRTTDELAVIAPGFQARRDKFEVSAWLDAMNAVTRPYFDVRGSDVITVPNVRFLTALQRLLENVNTQKPRVVPMYLSWYTLRRLGWTVAPNSPEWEHTNGPEQQRRCFDTVHDLMPLAAAKPFADTAAWDTALIEELFEASKRSYRKRIARSTWMDEAARQFAEDKIRSVQAVVPAPSLIWNASALERIYECVPQSRELYFLPSLLQTRQCKQRLLLRAATTGQSSAETITWTSPAAYLVRYLDVYNSAVVMGSVLYPPVLQVIEAS